MQLFTLINNFFDLPVSFLFAGSKGASRIGAYNYLHENNTRARYLGHTISMKEAVYSKEAYDIQIKRAFGFGFVASFIPGTDAFKARVNYMAATKKLDALIYSLMDRANLGIFEQLTFTLPTTPFYFLQHFTAVYADSIRLLSSNINYNRKDSGIKLFASLPIISAILSTSTGSVRANWGWALLNQLKNPVSIITSTLRFLHRGTDTLIELGSTKGEKSNSLRQGLKVASALLFLPTRFVSMTMETMVDIAYMLIKSLTIDLGTFLYDAIKQTVNNLNKELVYTDEDMLRGAKVIRIILKNSEAAKNTKFCDIYSTMSDKYNNTTEYLIQSKNTIFTRSADYPGGNENHPTVISTSPEKAKKLRGYITFFTENQDRFDIYGSVDEATITFVKAGF